MRRKGRFGTRQFVSQEVFERPPLPDHGAVFSYRLDERLRKKKIPDVFRVRVWCAAKAECARRDFEFRNPELLRGCKVQWRAAGTVQQWRIFRHGRRNAVKGEVKKICSVYLLQQVPVEISDGELVDLFIGSNRVVADARKYFEGVSQFADFRPVRKQENVGARIAAGAGPVIAGDEFPNRLEIAGQVVQDLFSVSAHCDLFGQERT